MGPQKPCLANCELFGSRADFWESTIVPLWQESYDSLISRARISEGSRVLDIGTGSGEVGIRMARLVGGKGRVVAIDAQPEMLQIASSKALQRGFRNIEFKETSMESMDLPDSSFDSAVGSYSLCCCTDYRASLAECYRVLKRGGRLTFNHGGPVRPLPFQVVANIFEGYKTGSPSESLKEMRRSVVVQAEAVEKYLDPFVTLEAMRGIGYAGAEATLTKEGLRYESARSYIDEWLLFDWGMETAEIPPADVERFRKEATDALMPLSKGAGFNVTRDTVFYTGVKN